MIRNTPILVQLLWVYYVLPIVFSVRIESLTALVNALLQGNAAAEAVLAAWLDGNENAPPQPSN